MKTTGTVLDLLAEHARERVEEAKRRISLHDIRQMAVASGKRDHEFEKALSTEGLSFILECKKASPSKGVIVSDFPYLDIARQYEEAGAQCISVLTEPKWFMGRDSYLEEIAKEVKIPCLRKDFTVDGYMIYEAATLGASAVLLITSILSKEQIKEYLDICDSLGISAITETHDEEEIGIAVEAGARIIGVNNRDLRDFSVDGANAGRLGRLIPKECIFVSESGISTPEDVARAHAAGADAVLIGEAVMLAPDKKEALRRLRSGL